MRNVEGGTESVLQAVVQPAGVFLQPVFRPNRLKMQLLI
jgi:hypothetical protein